MIGKPVVKLGKLFGIEVGLNKSWFLVFIFLVYSISSNMTSTGELPAAQALPFAVMTGLLIYLSILAHEFGHALTAKAFGINVRTIILHIFGGVAMLDSEPRRPRDEFWITVAGPAVSFLLAGCFLGAWGLGSWMQWPFAIVKLLLYVGMINLILGIFNCLPGFPMDGGRVVRSILWAATGDYLLATRVASWGGVGVGALICVWGASNIFGGDPGGGLLNLLLGMFLISLARASSRQAEFIALFQGLTARDVMRPVRAVVPAATPADEVLSHYFGVVGGDSLPVVQGSRLLGYVRAEDIRMLQPHQAPWIRAEELCRPYETSLIIAPNDEAMTIMERLARVRRHSVPVFEGRRLLGFVFDEDLARAMHHRQMLQKQAAR